MCNCLADYVRIPPRESNDDAVQSATTICDRGASIARYLLSIYEALAGLGGLACYYAGKAAFAGGKYALKAIEKGIIWLDRQIGKVLGLCGYATFRFLVAIEIVALKINNLIGLALGACGYGLNIAANAVKKNFATAASHVSRFAKNNWKQIAGYVLAWGIVITCSGALYGFQAVALPLTIGFGAGIGVGGILGILTTKIFDPEDKYRGKNTAWDLLNIGIEQLDQNGTRQIVLAISVTVVLAASVIFPYALGGIFGLLVGNQVITKMGFDRDLGQDPRNRRHQVTDIQRDLDELQRRIRQLEG